MRRRRGFASRFRVVRQAVEGIRSSKHLSQSKASLAGDQ
jgi:hypothetical protein